MTETNTRSVSTEGVDAYRRCDVFVVSIVGKVGTAELHEVRAELAHAARSDSGIRYSIVDLALSAFPDTQMLSALLATLAPSVADGSVRLVCNCLMGKAMFAQVQDRGVPVFDSIRAAIHDR